MDVPLSPKFHDHEVGEFVDASVNTTFKGAVPDVGVPLKSATGGKVGVVVVVDVVGDGVAVVVVVVVVPEGEIVGVGLSVGGRT